MTHGIVDSLNLILNERPILIAVAGSNGAGKSTFYNTHLRESGLPFVNADVLAAALRLGPYEAAGVADNIRRGLINRGESFVFETVFSDPEGEKLRFMLQAAEKGYTVVLFFIGMSGPEISQRRVAMRVAQGGHDVPSDKLVQRYPRTIENLKAGLSVVPHIHVLDNSNLLRPFRLVARFEKGRAVLVNQPVPEWLKAILPDGEGF